MKLLLVEDEPHKRDELVECINEVFHATPEIVDGVSQAVLNVMSEKYDLIVLDMALSTFGESADDRQKGHDQAQGGIEVLRALKLKGGVTNIIIVTQYPDFYIGGLEDLRFRHLHQFHFPDTGKFHGFHGDIFMPLR